MASDRISAGVENFEDLGSYNDLMSEFRDK